jgi:hypothetical protein
MSVDIVKLSAVLEGAKWSFPALERAIGATIGPDYPDDRKRFLFDLIHDVKAREFLKDLRRSGFPDAIVTGIRRIPNA